MQAVVSACFEPRKITDDPAFVAAWDPVTQKENHALRRAERAVQADLIRCIFGNPFRDPPTIPAAWLTADVLALAQGIYDDREWDRVGILADALQEAGCDAADLLAHLRGPGPHARGCWGVDTILGRS